MALRIWGWSMKRKVLTALAIFSLGTSVFSQGLDSFYKLGPDSLEHEGVPHGKLVGPLTLPCKVYPGTAHTYWVYVPAQYDPSRPPSLISSGRAMDTGPQPGGFG
jgi:hypothetical protein